MSQREVNAIAGRLSLRAPQAESLARLARAIEATPLTLKHDRNSAEVADVLKVLQQQFATLQDFERDFPSLCFALATGVGKTRLMGAFISYLYAAHGIKHFFVLAPNLTIYDKLIGDFTPNTPKYVFKGVAEFAAYPPEIITGDNYEERAQALGDLLSPVTINIFNIAKITSEVRGGKAPRIKRLSEYIGQSYFDYLAGLPDLVLLMDESHRYRATAGLRAINDLKPLLGLELTATPFVETTKGPVPFKNVVMDYPLARAMEDGFVKEPAVVTQRNFDAKSMPPEEVERVKLQDGVRMHEATKVELKTYARSHSVKEVKPFMLVIARDTTHASALLAHLQSEAFFAGRYRHKVIQVDSSKSGAEEEVMVRKLLAVESVDEPTEIVIHVNMLKEGWDVTNLYTIVPLRAANARTLVEQSIGRGLRLPYGKRTGVAAVDRLSIIAHDRFQEIIDDANRADSPIKLKTLILEAPDAGTEGTQSLTVSPNLAGALGLHQSEDAPADAVTPTSASGTPASTPVFSTAHERQAAQVVMQVLADYETRPTDAPTRQAFLSPGLQARIAEAVQQKLLPVQTSLLSGVDAPAELDVADVVRRTVEEVVKQTIDIPRIAVVPKGEVSSGFKPFMLDVAGLHLQPKDRSLVGQNLRTHEQFTYTAQPGRAERRLEDYIVHALIELDDIDYNTQASLLYDLAGQMVAHLRSYLADESEVRNVLDLDRQLIASNIHAQMLGHFDESATEYTVEVRRGFTALKEPTFTVGAGQAVRNYRDSVDEPSRIKQMVFGYFSRCLYPLQKFDSDTERRFAVILERDADKWLKPAKGQFQLFYKLGAEQPEYVPDFVAETAHFLLMVETKARNELGAQDVIAKAEAGALWCQHATDHAKQMGAKPWKYLLVPHDQVTEDKRLMDYLVFEHP
ncbi:DEAD/DEAH box helicase family protein [Rhodoferax sp.]|uniref:DEAD/DEAH box helicase n=1 Tax=Rhodoferax sp. TaxID=50421 RepID=UPI00260D5B1A|nr:DEAD/DEAH box helicase family protein [Rhodoferax sp.]MDD2810441.1 DEAD/DEAH box helicase family protein [Rhodoferax sp.]MDD4944571.1 DEAD/DEAH box helicase family protein [Rhodoferax sp.]